MQVNLHVGLCYFFKTEVVVQESNPCIHRARSFGVLSKLIYSPKVLEALWSPTKCYRFRSSAFRSRGDRFPICIQQYQWFRLSTCRSRGDRFSIRVQQYQWFRVLNIQITWQLVLDPCSAISVVQGSQHLYHVAIGSRSVFSNISGLGFSTFRSRGNGISIRVLQYQC